MKRRKKERKKKEKEQDDQTTTRERITRDPNISDEKENAGRDHLVLDVDAVFASSPCIPSSPPLVLTCVIWFTTRDGLLGVALKRMRKGCFLVLLFSSLILR